MYEYVPIMQDLESKSGLDGTDSTSQSWSPPAVNDPISPRVAGDEKVKGLDWEENDARNPINWSQTKKWMVMGAACFMYVTSRGSRPLVFLIFLLPFHERDVHCPSRLLVSFCPTRKRTYSARKYYTGRNKEKDSSI